MSWRGRGEPSPGLWPGLGAEVDSTGGGEEARGTLEVTDGLEREVTRGVGVALRLRGNWGRLRGRKLPGSPGETSGDLNMPVESQAKSL